MGKRPRFLVPGVVASLVVVQGCSALGLGNEAPEVGEILVEPDEVPILYITTLRFSAKDVRDPDGDALRHSWTFDYQGRNVEKAEGPSVSHTFKGVGNVLVTLAVGDGEHEVRTSRVIVARDLTGAWQGAYGDRAFTAELTHAPSGAIPGDFRGADGAGSVSAMARAPRTLDMFTPVSGGMSFSGTIDRSGDVVTGTVKRRGIELAFRMSR